MRALAIALCIVATACALLVILLAQTGNPQPIACVPDDETRDKIRAIMLDATETALREHVVRLHETWMKDDTHQPARATVGAQRGIRAFLGGRAFVLKWNPPICPKSP